MGRVVLYPFRYRSEITGKWVKARYVATREDIERRGGEIIGTPEIRDISDDGAYFYPYRVAASAEVKRLQESPPQINPHLERPPAIDDVERFLVGLFLRRYVTYGARLRRWAQMHGARGLYNELTNGQETREDVSHNHASGRNA